MSTLPSRGRSGSPRAASGPGPTTNAQRLSRAHALACPGHVTLNPKCRATECRVVVHGPQGSVPTHPQAAPQRQSAGGFGKKLGHQAVYKGDAARPQPRG